MSYSNYSLTNGGKKPFEEEASKEMYSCQYLG